MARYLRFSTLLNTPGARNVLEDVVGGMGTFSGSPAWISTDRGPAMQFNGSSLVQWTDRPFYRLGTPPFSLELCFRYTASQNAMPFSKRNTSTFEQYSFEVGGGTSGTPTTGTLIGGLTNSGSGGGFGGFGGTSTDSYNDGAWHHCFMIFGRTASDMRLFVDGRSRSITADFTTSVISTDGTAALQLGAGGNTTSFAFTGDILFARLWNRIITAPEAASLYVDPYQLYRDKRSFWAALTAPVLVPVTTLIHPISQVSIGNWTTQAGASTGLALMVDEDPFDDADYIRSGIGPASDTVILNLQPFDDPHLDAGFKMRIRLGKDLSGGLTIGQVATLQAGTTDIASGTFSNVSDTIAEVSFTLTAPEVQSFRSNGGFSDPRIKIVANQT